MDPSRNTANEGFNGNVPLQPSAEVGAGMSAGTEAPETGQTAAVPPLAPPASSSASWLPPSVPVQPSGAAGSNATSGAVAVATPASADDGDIIEKEWVLKAKHIVEQTKHDPYLQTKEMHKFRAEYMKKRYNKIIESVDE